MNEYLPYIAILISALGLLISFRDDQVAINAEFEAFKAWKASK